MTLSVATHRKLKADPSRPSGVEGEAPAEETVWHKVIVWSRLGEICADHLHTGNPIFVEGSIRTSRWIDKEGGRRTSTEIHADNVIFLGGALRRMPTSEEATVVRAAEPESYAAGLG